MDVLGSAGFVLNNEALTQNRLANDTSALASGLRVRSAANDPSGYAIAQTINTKVAGLQQSVNNVQTANNLLNVADGALSNIEDILQRIRSLVVESNSDINSASDIANIQTEINQLLLEVNRISSNVQFNGLTLFTGQYDNGSGATNQAASIVEVQSPLLGPDGATGSNEVANSQINTDGDPTGDGPGPLVEPYNQTITNNLPAYMTFQVLSYSPNAIDPDTGIDVGPGVYIQFSAYSQNPDFGAAPLFQDTSAVAVNAGPIINSIYAAPSAAGGGPPYELLQFSLANLTEADVGASAAFISTVASSTPTGTPLTVNDGGDEGTTVSIDIPAINTNVLNISDISVEAPQTVNYLNQITGQSSSNQIAASDAETRVDTALTTVNEVRAQLGAQNVSLNTDQGNDNTLIVNEQASSSNILDANIGQTVTDFTQTQVLQQVTVSVLSHLNVDALQVAALYLNALNATTLAP
jgi:flagellin